MAMDPGQAFQESIERGRAQVLKISFAVLGFIGVACLASFCGGGAHAI